MSAIRYAAVFAADLKLSCSMREHLGETDGIAAIAELVGSVMETQRAISAGAGQDFWPCAGAEAAAAFLNNSARLTTPIHGLIAATINNALVIGFTEGK